MLLWTLVSMCRFSNSCFFFLWIHTYIYIYMHPGVGLLGHAVVLFSVIRIVSTMLPVVVPVYIPTNSVKGFLSSASLPTFVIWGVFGDSILTGARCYLIVVSMCFSLMIHDFEHLFMYLYPLQWKECSKAIITRRILKSRDITLPTKVHQVKGMFFSVFMYGCEIWTIKKAEHWKIDDCDLWCLRRLLRVPFNLIWMM